MTPVCETELGAMSQWYDQFQALDTELIAVCGDPAVKLLQWRHAEPLLANPPYKTFSTYLLPTPSGWP
jgi:alkyl hydroperoxide reductase subunit AhpC